MWLLMSPSKMPTPQIGQFTVPGLWFSPAPGVTVGASFMSSERSTTSAADASRAPRLRPFPSLESSSLSQSDSLTASSSPCVRQEAGDWGLSSFSSSSSSVSCVARCPTLCRLEGPAPSSPSPLALDLILLGDCLVVVPAGPASACALRRVDRLVAAAGGSSGATAPAAPSPLLDLLALPPAPFFGGGVEATGALASLLTLAHARSSSLAALYAPTTASRAWFGRRSDSSPAVRQVGHSFLNSSVRRMHSEQ
mmetsp:Transcript_500/g.2343  ORF Transcript_500/g.2343 Transcript_500/m.2343 type:complete len:252 (-) Transcript_500:118-873(-)